MTLEGGQKTTRAVVEIPRNSKGWFSDEGERRRGIWNIHRACMANCRLLKCQMLEWVYVDEEWITVR